MKERLTVTRLRAAKQERRKLKMVTAYDYASAVLVDRSPIDMILVGDTLGQVMLGYRTTTPVTLEEMLHHVRAVAAGAPNTLIVGDMPFGTYNASPQQAVESASRLLKAGVDAVKLEGGVEMAETVRAVVRAGIPVMGHIGLTPQTVHPSAWKVQGREVEAARRLIEDALALEGAGVCSLLLEVVAAPLAAEVTERLSVPTIGIGSGAGCDGQVLIWHDLLGLHDARPRHARRYAELGEAIGKALGQYCAEVDAGTFPAPENSFRMDPGVLAAARQAWPARSRNSTDSGS